MAARRARRAARDRADRTARAAARAAAALRREPVHVLARPALGGRRRADRAGPLPARARARRCCSPARSSPAARRGLALPRARRPAGVPLAQVALLALAVVCVVVQQRLVYEVPIYQPGVFHRWRYFTPATLVAAGALAAGAFVAARPAAWRARVAAGCARRDRRRLLAALLAVAAHRAVAAARRQHRQLDHGHQLARVEPGAVHARRDLRGRQRPHAARRLHRPVRLAVAVPAGGRARALRRRRSSPSRSRCARSRRSRCSPCTRCCGGSSRNGVTALLLYLPVLATSLFIVGGTRTSRYTFGDYFGVFPLRYAGPFLLAWLLVRQLDGARPRRPWPLFLVAGLCALNNAEFGLAGARRDRRRARVGAADRGRARARPARRRARARAARRLRARRAADAGPRRRAAAARPPARLRQALLGRRLRAAARCTAARHAPVLYPPTRRRSRVATVRAIERRAEPRADRPCSRGAACSGSARPPTSWAARTRNCSSRCSRRGR